MKKDITAQQYEKIYRRYADDVYKICIYYVRDEEKAKTIVEKAFRSLYENIDHVLPNYTLGYLINEVKSMLRDKSEEKLASEEVRE